MAATTAVATSSGSGAVPAYDGTRFARDGVVCVTINYRLGADGFLWFGDRPPQRLADAMHRAWVNFATAGDPRWPSYQTGTRHVMRFDGSALVSDPRGSTPRLWDGVR